MPVARPATAGRYDFLARYSSADAEGLRQETILLLGAPFAETPLEESGSAVGSGGPTTEQIASWAEQTTADAMARLGPPDPAIQGLRDVDGLDVESTAHL